MRDRVSVTNGARPPYATAERAVLQRDAVLEVLLDIRDQLEVIADSLRSRPPLDNVPRT